MGRITASAGALNVRRLPFDDLKAHVDHWLCDRFTPAAVNHQSSCKAPDFGAIHMDGRDRK